MFNCYHSFRSTIIIRILRCVVVWIGNIEVLVLCSFAFRMVNGRRSESIKWSSADICFEWIHTFLSLLPTFSLFYIANSKFLLFWLVRWLENLVVRDWSVGTCFLCLSIVNGSMSESIKWPLVWYKHFEWIHTFTSLPPTLSKFHIANSEFPFLWLVGW